jgi:hypothetical protein
MADHLGRTLVTSFVERPAEAAIIGRILAGYGEIEFFVYECLLAVLGYANIAARVMFRLRSESHRLEAADALPAKATACEKSTSLLSQRRTTAENFEINTLTVTGCLKPMRVFFSAISKRALGAVLAI